MWDGGLACWVTVVWVGVAGGEEDCCAGVLDPGRESGLVSGAEGGVIVGC